MNFNDIDTSIPEDNRSQVIAQQVLDFISTKFKELWQTNTVDRPLVFEHIQDKTWSIETVPSYNSTVIIPEMLRLFYRELMAIDANFIIPDDFLGHGGEIGHYLTIKTYSCDMDFYVRLLIFLYEKCNIIPALAFADTYYVMDRDYDSQINRLPSILSTIRLIQRSLIDKGYGDMCSQLKILTSQLPPYIDCNNFITIAERLV